MFEVSFERVTVSKPSRYVILLKNVIETKRTDIAVDYTSSPHFPPLIIEELAGLEVKLCEAGLDRKIRVVGVARLPEEKVDLGGEVVFEGEVKLQQEVEGKMVCVGLLQLRIAPQKQFQPVPDVVKQLRTEVSQMEGNGYAEEVQEEDYELHADPLPEGEGQDEDDEDELRVEVHCGFNFFLGSEFHVEVQWGQSLFCTRSIKDKISPVWAEGGRVSGNPSRPITLSVKDSKGNILESLKFSLPSLRTLFPYHLRLLFRQEYLGATPELYLSLIRESPARHSITELPLKFGIRNIGEPVRNALYLMLSLNPQEKVPTFMTLDRSQSSSLEQANQWLTSRSSGEDSRVDLVGLANDPTPKGFSIFKSYLSRKIYLHFLLVNDPKSWFSAGNWESARVIDSRSDLSPILKKVYYQGEPFTIKKMLEFFNPAGGEQEEGGEGRTAAERWKLLSRNYILRSKMVQKSTKHIQQLQSAIQTKGVELVQIKKLLNQIKTVNSTLVGKEKVMTAIRGRSRAGKIMVKEIDAAGLISALYEKQAILEGQKRINAELALRMDSLTGVQENQQDLLRSLTANSGRLLDQQASITRMRRMQQAIKQQRQIIGQLQRIFQRSEMDKRVNQALQQQRDRLEHLRGQKQEDLKKVYRMVKENNQQAGNLRAKVKHAEETLVKLNEQYARLTAL